MRDCLYKIVLTVAGLLHLDRWYPLRMSLVTMHTYMRLNGDLKVTPLTSCGKTNQPIYLSIRMSTDYINTVFVIYTWKAHCHIACCVSRLCRVYLNANMPSYISTARKIKPLLAHVWATVYTVCTHIICNIDTAWAKCVHHNGMTVGINSILGVCNALSMLLCVYTCVY